MVPGVGQTRAKPNPVPAIKCFKKAGVKQARNAASLNFALDNVQSDQVAVNAKDVEEAVLKQGTGSPSSQRFRIYVLFRNTNNWTMEEIISKPKSKRFFWVGYIRPKAKIRAIQKADACL